MDSQQKTQRYGLITIEPQWLFANIRVRALTAEFPRQYNKHPRLFLRLNFPKSKLLQGTIVNLLFFLSWWILKPVDSVGALLRYKLFIYKIFANLKLP